MCYNERKQRIADLVHSTPPPADGLPHGNGITNPTEQKGIVITELQRQNDIIEKAAELTDKVLSPWLVLAVTNDYKYHYLRTVKNIPCNEKDFFKLRRIFFYHLDKFK